MDDTEELIIRLCTQVGVLMEDTSIAALTLGAVPGPDRATAIVDLCAIAETFVSLMDAARALSH